MKVIIIKDCKDGKENDVVDVQGGYATNFLIKNGFALPFNKATKRMLDKKIQKVNSNKEIEENALLLFKQKIESFEIEFKVSVLADGSLAHSITRKQVMKELFKRDLHIDSYDIENIKIQGIGNTEIRISLSKKIIAKLKIKVVKNG